MPGNVATELTYTLPDDKVSVFPQMLAELEEAKDSLGISGFGISVTTMEEVFIKYVLCCNQWWGVYVIVETLPQLDM